MRKPPTAEQLRDYQLVHDHAGNGLIMVEDIDKKYCRVFSTGAKCDPPFNQAFLAAKDRLRVELIYNDDPNAPQIPRPIPEELAAPLHKLREMIVAGEMRYHES